MVPELSLYDKGIPPARATYVIDGDGRDVRIRVSWVPGGASELATMQFDGRADGEVRPLPQDHDGVSVRITRIDDRTLETEVWQGDSITSTARRVASFDGSLLVVEQTAHHPADGPLRTFQVYRRQVLDGQGPSL